MVESGRKNTVVPVPRAGTELLDRALRRALLVSLLPRRAVALDGGNEFARERVHHRCAHAVQAAGRLVVLPLELAAGVQRGEDDFERARLRGRVLIHRNPAPIV